MNDQAAALENFFRLMNVNGAARVFHEALACGLLDALLQDPPVDAAALAQQCHLAPRPTALLLDVLISLGLAEKKAAAYSATPLARSLLAGSYRTLGDPYWNHLPAFLKSDQPIAQMDNPVHSEAHYAAQAEALAWMSAPAAQCAAKILAAENALAGAHVLDIGAGSAIWSLTLASHVPDLTITALDWPQVLAIAQKFAQRFQVPSQRFHTLAGNYHHIDLPEKTFDLAILASVLHLEPPEQCESLLKKIRAALKQTGRIIIVDILPSDTPGQTDPLTAALYALGLALRTRSARLHPLAKLEKMLVSSGFDVPRLTTLNAPPNTFEMLTSWAASPQ